MLSDFDFDARCAVTGFSLTRIARRGDPVTVKNLGPSYQPTTRRLVRLAKPGDIYFFSDVRAKCPGDIATRRVNTLVFTIR